MGQSFHTFAAAFLTIFALTSCDGGDEPEQPAQELVSAPNAVALAVDANNIYWIAEETRSNGAVGTIMSAPLQGGAVSTIVTEQIDPGVLFSDGGDVFWTTGGMYIGDSFVGSGVMRLAAGETTPVLIQGSEACWNSGLLHNVSVDDANVYCTEVNGGYPDEGNVVRIPRSGGAPTTIAPGQDAPWAVDVDAANVYWVNLFDGDFGGPGAAMKLALDGGTPVALAPLESAATDIVVDRANAYVLQGTGLTAVPLDGSPPTVLVHQPDSGIGGGRKLIVEGSDLFWIANSGAKARVMRMSLPGGAPTAMSLDAVQSQALAVDDAYVYWVDAAKQTIMRLAR